MSGRQVGLPLIGALLGLALLVTACGGSGGSAEGSAEEQAFLEAMVPHHTSAIDMAGLAQERAQSSEIERLANSIIQDQEAEIEQMGSIHQRLFGSALTPDEMAHEQLGLSAEEAGMEHMDAAARLRTARPFDREFVDEMVGHHAGAIAMAEAVLPDTDDADLQQLAENIITTQQEEIAEMNAFRTEEFGAPVPDAGESGMLELPPGAEHEGH